MEETEGIQQDQPDVPVVNESSVETPSYFHSWKTDDGEEHNFKNPEELNDFIRGHYLRTSDYTRKRQSDAEARKQWEREREAEKKEIDRMRREYGEYNEFLTKNKGAFESVKKQILSQKNGTQSNAQLEELQKRLDAFEDSYRRKETESAKQQRIAKIVGDIAKEHGVAPEVFEKDYAAFKETLVPGEGDKMARLMFARYKYGNRQQAPPNLLKTGTSVVDIPEEASSYDDVADVLRKKMGTK